MPGRMRRRKVWRVRSSIVITILLGCPIEEAAADPWFSRADADQPRAMASHGMVKSELKSLARSTAQRNALPVEYFVRLISKESAFEPGSVSPAGALGIAQFMPATASERGLADPFDPVMSLSKSAEMLRDLRRRFGNLGLAAAAYNGGSGRVRSWLSGTGMLPTETRRYVLAITGRRAEDWLPARSRALYRPAYTGLSTSRAPVVERETMQGFELRLLREVTEAAPDKPGRSATLEPAKSKGRLAAVGKARQSVGRADGGLAAAEGALCPSCTIKARF